MFCSPNGISPPPNWSGRRSFSTTGSSFHSCYPSFSMWWKLISYTADWGQVRMVWLLLIPGQRKQTSATKLSQVGPNPHASWYPTALRASSLGRLRLPMFLRNQMHSSSLVLRFPKMYVTTLGYKGKILHQQYRAEKTFKSEIFPLLFRVAILIFRF